MKTIRFWKARRAGGRITITGQNEAGEDFKVVGVDSIVGGAYAGPETGHVAMPVATDKNGEKYALV